MVRPLRKHTLDGILYARRPAVEEEISSLECLSLLELEARCKISSKNSEGYVSTEALLYFLRQSNDLEALQERLLALLLGRFHRLLPRFSNGDGNPSSLTSTFIRDEVNDRFIGLLMSDRVSYEEKLDYFEINFNSAVTADKYDAKTKFWTLENRHSPLSTEGEQDEISEEANANSDSYDPFDPAELDKKNYRRWLVEAIEELPELQQRIIEMWTQDIPIDSGDSSVVTISKTLQKAEKTIRNQRDKAFEALRKKLQFKEANQ